MSTFEDDETKPDESENPVEAPATLPEEPDVPAAEPEEEADLTDPERL